jgi:hypothetical protein
MTNAIIDKLIKFRTDLFSLFKYRSDSTMDLVDAIAGQSSKESAVKISLSNLFRRTYSSITDVVDNLFRREADVNLTHDEMQEAHFKMTELLIEQCPQPIKRPFDKKRIAPGVCVTCDPIRDIEARLSLCIGAHKTLTEQVNGWDLPLCPGRIICLKYEGMKFVHVKTIDVQRFVTEYYSFKHKWTGWLFNAKLFCRLFLEEMKRWFKVSK